MSELVYGWCGLCQQHTTFPHDCPGDGEVDQKLTDDEERSRNVPEDEAA